MPSESCRWYPDSVIHHKHGESYTISTGKYKNPYDLATNDAAITEYTRVDRGRAKAKAVINGIHPKFRGLQGVTCEFVLRSSVTQLGVNAENVEVDLNPTMRECVISLDLVALSPLAVLMLDYIVVGSHIGKLFAVESNRVVRDISYIQRLLKAVNQQGQRLLMYGAGDNPDWELKIVKDRVVAYLPVLPGTFTYSGEVHGLLPTVGLALKRGTAYKDLIRLHQEFHSDFSRLGSPTGTLMVRGYAMHFRTLFGRVCEDLLPAGLKCMRSNVIEPEEHAPSTMRDRTFVFYGESSEELTHIPIEFYTVESFRESIPFALRKTLAARCSNINDMLKVLKTAPDNGLPCCAFLCKGGQFNEMTEDDWITANPRRTSFLGYDHPEEQQERISNYAYQQCEYGILSAIAMDDISSEGVLITRYFPSPCLKSLVLSRAVAKKMRAVFFTQASREFGQFFSQEDAALLGDLTSFGISVFHVDERKSEMFQYIRRPGRDAGQFVPINRRQEYMDATFFGVYGSNLVAGDFEAELMQLLNGILQVKKTAKHALLNQDKPLALVTGGGPGAMEVGNRVACSLGILSCGLVVDFGSVSSKPGATINEQHQNPYCEAYFTYRADKLVERQSDFNLDFPIFLYGGIGTDFEYALEEVRRKVGTVEANPVILFGTAEHWGEKLSGRFRTNLHSGTIKGSEWISTVPWVVSTGQEALEVYTHFFNGTLPIGPNYPSNDRGYMVAAEFLAGK
ncbi:hypothetical protein AGDE_06965 [Angomonas deanei]|uniref:Lysine decarboxylase n=1 Tax=Angomonas deanei TaxID=59799 RepID=S9WGJ2_9TRYP|nr:hypothetical protein AGDE_07761 [Angomonas deanei]EPY36334.1 hypothetical protein AGDE_06965 [Angomonas deanei]CAD2216876.1 hypothetical protein, conserved [Angomonas deanei]|eukprot:EPY34875.1 hypothetical protein AGDE_07761 [Angomonas deanei]